MGVEELGKSWSCAGENRKKDWTGFVLIWNVFGEAVLSRDELVPEPAFCYFYH